MFTSEIPLNFEKDHFLKACANWKNYPSTPAVYILAIDQPFKYGENQTKATDHEANIIKKIQEIEASGKRVYIYWNCNLPKQQTHKEIEKQLLQQFKKGHGQLPILNRRE
jgi:hypothetical protein